VKSALLTAVVILAATAAVRAEDGAKREFPADGIKALKVQTESGDIEAGAGGRITVEVVGNNKPKLCRLTLEVQDGVLVLKAESARRWFVPGAGCGAGFRVTAPAALALDATAGSGDVRVSGRAGAARLIAGSGQISGEALSGTADVKVGSGNAALAWARAPKGDVSVKSGSGDVVLRFPKDTKLSAHQIAGSGTAINNLGEAQYATLNVAVVTGSGNSTIEAAP
jgi:DUF4097 and DUF4098 domain-containing protein YvlB